MSRAFPTTLWTPAAGNQYPSRSTSNGGGQMNSPRDAAIAAEVVKVAMRQTKDGLTVTFAIHPNDNTNDLLIHPIGSRYQIALVMLDDEGQPVVPPGRNKAKQAVVAAGMLCREHNFINWLVQNRAIQTASEDSAVEWLHRYCGIASRSELATNLEARRLFDTIRLRFSQSRSL